jgi:hypothetical protein
MARRVRSIGQEKGIGNQEFELEEGGLFWDVRLIDRQAKHHFELVDGGGGVTGKVVVEEGVDGSGSFEFGLKLSVPVFQDGGDVFLEMGFAFKSAVATEEADIMEIGSAVETWFHDDVFGGDPTDVMLME